MAICQSSNDRLPELWWPVWFVPDLRAVCTLHDKTNMGTKWASRAKSTVNLGRFSGPRDFQFSVTQQQLETTKVEDDAETRPDLLLRWRLVSIQYSQKKNTDKTITSVL